MEPPSALVDSPADMARIVDAVRVALLTPVAPDEAALAVVARKAAALARRPLLDPALVDVASCTGAYLASTRLHHGPRSSGSLASRRARFGRVAIVTTGGVSSRIRRRTRSGGRRHGLAQRR